MAFVLGAGVSLAIGILTGLFFERRSVGETERSNEELTRQVTGLRTALRSMGATPRETVAVQEGPTDLTEQVTLRAIATQDASGRVDRRVLVSHFLEVSYCLGEIDDVINSLCAAGLAEVRGPWLQMA